MLRFYNKLIGLTHVEIKDNIEKAQKDDKPSDNVKESTQGEKDIMQNIQERVIFAPLNSDANDEPHNYYNFAFHQPEPDSDDVPFGEMQELASMTGCKSILIIISL